MNYYDAGGKRWSCGICKFQIRDETVTLDFGLKKIPVFYPVTAKLSLVFGETGEVLQKECRIEEKKENYRFSFNCSRERMGSGQMYCYLTLGSRRFICDEETMACFVTRQGGDLPEKGNKLPEQADEGVEDIQGTETGTEGNIREVKAESAVAAPNTNRVQESTEDKLVGEGATDVRAAEQSVVSIPDLSGHRATYYVVSPRKLEQFGEEFAGYEENSFLLHGYYNYRHVLVGPVDRHDSGHMRIGVPGNYYKREEIVAGMFGFMEFAPAKGGRQTGAFGYYYTPRMPVRSM